jgi:hypothetical protein
MSEATLPAVACMQPGDHYCGIYRTDEDQRKIITSFVREGVARGEKMFYLVNLQTADELCETLRRAGIAVDALIENCQLVIMTAKDAYLRSGQFDPEAMIKLLADETDKALAEGYPALRATGEMTWALAGEPGSERLIEYEARINGLFKDRKFYAICQYDRRRFDPEMLLDILHTHPKVLHGMNGFDNSRMYFIPPELFLERDRQSATLDTWLRNLSNSPAT